MIYVNGSQLAILPFDSSLYQAILHSDWLRVSLHATTDERYAHLVRDRERLGVPLQVGIGFVTQHDNKELDTGTYGEITIDFADSMIAPINGWDTSPHIETSNNCRVGWRYAISNTTDYRNVLTHTAKKQFDTRLCSQCMSGQKAINALWLYPSHKLPIVLDLHLSSHYETIIVYE